MSVVPTRALLFFHFMLGRNPLRWREPFLLLWTLVFVFVYSTCVTFASDVLSLCSPQPLCSQKQCLLNLFFFFLCPSQGSVILNKKIYIVSFLIGPANIDKNDVPLEVVRSIVGNHRLGQFQLTTYGQDTRDMMFDFNSLNPFVCSLSKLKDSNKAIRFSFVYFFSHREEGVCSEERQGQSMSTLCEGGSFLHVHTVTGDSFTWTVCFCLLSFEITAATVCVLC